MGNTSNKPHSFGDANGLHPLSRSATRNAVPASADSNGATITVLHPISGCSDSIAQLIGAKDRAPESSGSVVDAGSLDQLGSTVIWTLSSSAEAFHVDLGSAAKCLLSSKFQLAELQREWRLACVLDDGNVQPTSLCLYLVSLDACSRAASLLCEFRLELLSATDMAESHNADSSVASVARGTSQSLQQVFSRQSPAWGLRLRHACFHPWPRACAAAPQGGRSDGDEPVLRVRLEIINIKDVSLEPAAAPQDIVPQWMQAVHLVSESPRVFVIERFLEPDQCEYLMTFAGPRLIRSKVSSGSETPSRTSSSTFFTGDAAKDSVVVEVERRISEIMATPLILAGHKSLCKTEALQVVRYKAGEFYAEHYDNKAGGEVMRAATIIVYLQDTPRGGATYFPRSSGLPEGRSAPDRVDVVPARQATQAPNRHGLRVYPVRGRAIIFWSKLPGGREDLASIHAGEKVEEGDKWIATRWLKEL